MEMQREHRAQQQSPLVRSGRGGERRSNRYIRTCYEQYVFSYRNVYIDHEHLPIQLLHEHVH